MFIAYLHCLDFWPRFCQLTLYLAVCQLPTSACSWLRSCLWFSAFLFSCYGIQFINEPCFKLNLVYPWFTTSCTPTHLISVLPSSSLQYLHLHTFALPLPWQTLSQLLGVLGWEFCKGPSPWAPHTATWKGPTSPQSVDVCVFFGMRLQ